MNTDEKKGMKLEQLMDEAERLFLGNQTDEAIELVKKIVVGGL